MVQPVSSVNAKDHQCEILKIIICTDLPWDAPVIKQI